MLILPAITMEKYYCGYEEHLHSTDCYTDGELTCGYQEHVHTDECREELLDGAAPALTNQENSQMQASEDAPAGLSIDSIEIIVGIENLFGVDISGAGATREDFRSIETLTAFVEAHKED